MEVLNYSYHTTIEDKQQMFGYIAAFAVSQGWSLVELQENVSWQNLGGGVYGWGSGNDCYMELSSTGYGSQSLRYRFHAKYDSATNVWLYISAAIPTNPAYATNTSTIPNLQSACSWWQECSSVWGSSPARISMPTSRFPALWVWGDEKTIIVIMQLSAVLFDSFAFGSPRLFSEFQSTTEAHGLWVGKDSYSDAANDAYWWNFESEFDRWFWCFGSWPATSGETNYYSIYFKNIWWEGAARGNDNSVSPPILEYGPSLTILRSGGTWGSFTYEQFGRYPFPKNVVSYNDWTDKRVGISPVALVRNYSGSYPAPPTYAIGTFPFAYIPWEGLSPGETVKFGTDLYMTFPLNCYLDDYGVALRYS